MKRIDFAIVFVVVGLVFQLIWYGMLWAGMIFHSDVDKPIDFSIFYTAGRIADLGHYYQLYDLQTQLAVQEALLNRSLRVEELLPFNHPPLLVPILQIICTSNYLVSYWRWVGVMICFLVVICFLINRLLGSMGWGRWERAYFLAALMLFFPLFASLLKGQDTAFLLLGGTLWIYGMVVKKDNVAGLGLAMTVIRPQIALVLSIPFLFNRQRVWWWFCTGAAGLALYSLALVGFGGIRDFIHLMVVSAAGEGYGMIQNHMFNFTGMMLRMFPQVNVGLVHGLAWGLFLAVIIGLSVIWRLTSRIQLWHLVLAACLSVFAAPHLHSHDLAFLLLPVLVTSLIITRCKPSQSKFGPAVLPVAASLVLLFAEIWDPLLFTVPYLLMLALSALAWFYETRRSPERIHLIQTM